MSKLLKLFSIPLLLHCLPAAAEKIVLNTANTVVIRSEIDGGSMVRAQLDLAKQVVKRGRAGYPIYLVLDSPGGSIDAGNMFIQFAKMIPNLHTISIFAASMASAIAEQLPGDRLVTANGTMMFHMAYAGMEGTVETGSLESRLWYIKRMVLKLENGNASRMKMKLTDYKGLVAHELWLDAEDSLLYRAADRQVDLSCTAELISRTEQQIFNTFFGAIAVTFSGCPLFRAPVAVSSAKFKYEYGAIAYSTRKNKGL